LVKNLALLAHITTDETDTTPIERLCTDLGVEDACRLSGCDVHQRSSSVRKDEAAGAGYYVVFLNGNILGVHQRPHVLVSSLRHLRRQGLTGEFVSVYLHEAQRAVHLATDGGRVCRPLIIVDQDTGRPKLEQSHIEALAMKVLTMRDLLRQGIVEYVDCNEENNTLIAVTEKDLKLAIEQGLDNLRMRYTHLEIDPFTILGVVGGVIPVRKILTRSFRLRLGFPVASSSHDLLVLCYVSSSLITTSLRETPTPWPWRNKPWGLWP
jgi:DNA-directed RNA polymerase III subunit RPC2